MSVAGDIIDDLVIDTSIQYSAITGVFGALAVGLFVTIGLAGGSTHTEPELFASENPHIASTSKLHSEDLS